MTLSRWILSSACIALMGLAAPLMAQDAAAASGNKASRAFGYILVGLFVALGLMAVCRPGNRTSEIKRVEEEE